MEKRIRLEMLITEREAMIAENQWRLSMGQAQAYTEDSFMIVRSHMEELLSVEVNDAHISS